MSAGSLLVLVVVFIDVVFLVVLGVPLLARRCWNVPSQLPVPAPAKTRPGPDARPTPGPGRPIRLSDDPPRPYDGSGVIIGPAEAGDEP